MGRAWQPSPVVCASPAIRLPSAVGVRDFAVACLAVSGADSTVGGDRVAGGGNRFTDCATGLLIEGEGALVRGNLVGIGGSGDAVMSIGIDIQAEGATIGGLEIAAPLANYAGNLTDAIRVAARRLQKHSTACSLQATYSGAIPRADSAADPRRHDPAAKRGHQGHWEFVRIRRRGRRFLAHRSREHADIGQHHPGQYVRGP